MSKELQAALVKFLSLVNQLLEKELGGETKPSKKPAKTKPEPEAEDDDMGLDDGEVEDVTAEETEETEDEEPEVEDDDAEDIDVDQVKAAFSKYCKAFGDVKKGRAAARKILAKFKVQSVDDLKAKDYAKVLEMLKKK